MALIQCPECGKQISNTAKKCPQCGHPLNAKDVKGILKKQVLAASTLILLVVIPIFLSWAYRNMLYGESKKAYDMIVMASVSFPMPESVRIEGGQLSGISLRCILSSANGIGDRVKAYYEIYEDGRVERRPDYFSDDYYEDYRDRSSLKIELINKALGKRALSRS